MLPVSASADELKAEARREHDPAVRKFLGRNRVRRRRQVIGSLWYCRFAFAKPWMNAMGYDPDGSDVGEVCWVLGVR